MQRHLDLSLLRTLVAIAEKETFALAAQETHKTQSAITQQMQRLEEQIGAPLFEKQGRGKKLTPQAQRLLEYAKRMLALNDEVLRSMQSSSATGILRFGGLQDVADTVLPHLLAHVARAYPMLQIHIHVGRSEELNHMLKRGQLDLTLGTRQDSELREVNVRTSPTVWLCSANFVHEQDQPLPLILGDESSLFRRLAIETLDRNRVRWRLAYYAQSLFAVKAAVRAGLGVAARSIESLGPDMRVLGEKENLPRLPDVTYRLCMRKEALDRRIRDVFDLLVETLGLDAPPP
jgi:DNA-binding transcriptional LysR family regulator